MKKTLSYLILAAALVFAWKAVELRLDLYGYTGEDIARSLSLSLTWMALPAIIAAIALSHFYKRVSPLPRQLFFPILLVGALFIARFQGELLGAVIVYFTIKNRALFLGQHATARGG